MTPYLHALAAELARRNPAYEPIARELHNALRLAHHNLGKPRPRPQTPPANDFSQQTTAALLEQLRQSLQAEQTCAVGKSPEIHACATRILAEMEQF